MSTHFSEENLYDQVLTDDVEGFLSRLSAWIDVDPSTSGKRAKSAVDALSRLESEAPGLQQRVGLAPGSIEPKLAATFQAACGQVDSLLDDWRRHLGQVAPGDPRGFVNLDKLQSQLSERAARQELGVPTGAVPALIEERTGTGSWAAAGGMGIFALGWNAFTLFHAVLMIGGMMRAFGPVALFLLLFYAIFFSVGFSMAYSAYQAASDESIVLEGRTLKVTRSFLGKEKSKLYTLGDNARAEVASTLSGVPAFSSNSAGNRRSITAVVLTTSEGKKVSVGLRLMPQEKQSLASRINAYLSAQPPALP